MPTPTVSYDSLKATFEKAKQGHVLQYYDSLTSEQQQSLCEQLSTIEPERVAKIFKTAMTAAENAKNAKTLNIDPIPQEMSASAYSTSPTQLTEWYNAGLEHIANGKVGVILMAGGQGTRLGSSLPKGCFDIDLPSHKSLFQIQAERIHKIQDLANIQFKKQALITWYVMTSGPTRAETEAFFVKNNFFGLQKKQVIFFQQGVLPAMTTDGLIFLEEKHQVSVAPDGNGGIYAALVKEKILESLKERGITHVHAYCVDNCLVKVADPTFLGYALRSSSDCAVKVVRKLVPEEPVGLVVLKDKVPAVVEYSEIPVSVMEERASADVLKYRAANIANHLFSVDFLDRVCAAEGDLEYHVAHKKIKHISADGSQVSPSKPNGVKMELFVFDVFQHARKLVVFEGKREDEFSPLKNKEGVDSASTSRAAVLSQCTQWLLAAGAQVEGEVEVGPLVSYGGEGLESVKGEKFVGPKCLESL